MDWSRIIDQFGKTTDLCSFSKRENMNRVQRCIRGNAKESVEYLLNFPAQLDKVLSVLDRRFGKSEFIIERINLKNQPGSIY